MKKLICLALICLQITVSTAQTNLKKTEILVLGTSHLGQIKGFKPSMLNNVIGKLNSMNFDVVCVEKMPGQLLYDIQSRKDSAFDELKTRWGKKYLALADTVQKTKHIRFPEAEKNIELLLKKKELNTNDRKELFYNYLAFTDLPSAALQYEYLGKNKDLFSSDFDKYLIENVEKQINTNNEYYMLAVPLAKLQNIEKIEAIDNFQDETLLLKYFPEFIADYQEHTEELGKIMDQPVFENTKELTELGIRSNDFSKLYSFQNSEEFMTQDFEAQWKIWLKTDFSSGSDRARYSLWEMRNLQIAANILQVAARHSGEKILVIIGASHKRFLEKYLKQMDDIQVLTYE